MERTLLYYPTIELPRDDWLRQSLLYSDKVSSILPFNEDRIFTETIKYLISEDEYFPIFIDELIEQNENVFKNFETDFLNKADNPKIFENASFEKDIIYGIFNSKMTYFLIRRLEEKGLILKRTREKIFIKENLGIFYMAGLARFAAKVIKDKYIIPSTNYKYFSDITFENALKNEKAYNLIFKNCLPIPDNSVKLSSIINFKKKNKDDLNKFRQFQMNLIKEINSASDEDEAKEYIVAAKERIEIELKELNNCFIKNKIKTIFISLNTFFGVEKPKLFDSLIGAGIISTPINPKIGIGIASIGLVVKLIDNTFFSPSSKNELNYLFEAKKKKII